jgi:cytochrome c oxidase assembly protein subunit 15
VVLLALGTLAILAVRRGDGGMERGSGLALGAVLLLQVGLGIANVVGHLPLPVAVAHTGGAALVLLALLTLVHRLRPVPIARAVGAAANPPDSRPQQLRECRS